MITIEDFLEKYPDLESFKKDFPVGTKFMWCDREKHTIVDYCTDKEFKENGYTDLVVFKIWSRHKQCWRYNVCSTYEFYFTWDMVKRELGK
jgi:hypothetical protein